MNGGQRVSIRSASLSPTMLKVMVIRFDACRRDVGVALKIENRIEITARAPPLFPSVIHIMIDRIDTRERDIAVGLSIVPSVEFGSNHAQHRIDDLRYVLLHLTPR